MTGLQPAAWRQRSLQFEPLILDYFCGGGGASAGIQQATGRSPCVAVNHDAAAIAMHATNHPDTLHLKENVWDVDPRRDLPQGDVWFGWFSPSCTHFSRARGGKPVSKQLRSLPWVMARVAKHRKPALLFLENVSEMQTWGPLHEDGTPIESRIGQTWRAFIGRIRRLGYVVEHRILDAADYGAATHRRRLVVIARRDGKPIVWPEPTHGPGRSRPFVTAASCINWTLPCPSIFDREKPLVPATERRIAKGVQRYVLGARPFLVDVPDGKIAAFFAQKGQGERKGQEPRTRSVERPYSTIVAGGNKQWLVAVYVAKHNGKTVGQSVAEPLHTITAKDTKRAVAVLLAKNPRPERAALVADFLVRHGAVAPCDVVTVDIDGETYAIVDIGTRVLIPRELATCQGIPSSYVLTGTQTEQVCRIGNSVSPPMARAVVAANVGQYVARAA